LKRKLWALNLVLIAAIAAGSWQLRKESIAMKERQRAFLNQRPPAPPPPVAPPPAPAPVAHASSYIDVAQKMLWAKDRNSTVIVDPPKPPEPPKPLPPLPAVHGVMNLGDGPILMMSEGANARHRGVRAGDMIGVFKLVAVEGEVIELAYDNRSVRKKITELMDRGDDGAPAGPAPAPSANTPPHLVNAAPTPPPPPAKPEPGVKITETLSACQPGDSSPAGTVVNGMRKVVRQTPFGASCVWESVK
jgi:hypothetical protein